MTIVKMYDAATQQGVDAIPANAKAVMGYVDGHYQSFNLLVRRFYPRARCVSVGVEIGHSAEFSDIEPGNPINTPALIRDDFLRRKARGVWRPGFYADRTRMGDTVLPGLTGIPREEYRLILSNPDRDGVLTRQEIKNYDAVQDAFDGLYDVTLVNVDKFFPKHERPKVVPRPHVPTKIKTVVKKIHPAIPTAGLASGIAAALAAGGVKLTPTEWTTLGAVLTALAAAVNQKARGK